MVVYIGNSAKMVVYIGNSAKMALTWELKLF